jgi:uroporphyrinogen-III decarboxylase
MTTSSSKNRTVRTFLRLPTDRVPIFEHVIDRRYIHFAIGDKAECSLGIAPQDHLALARFMGMDLVTLGYVSRVKGTSSREEFHKMALAPHEPFLSRVKEYVEVLGNSEVGLNVYVHGPLDSTYLSMGYEPFFYNIHDDPGLVEEMMDVFTKDAVQMVHHLLQFPLATVQIVDDVAYKNGLFIRPELFKRLWMPRMQKILDPLHRSGMPVFFHSDGDVRHFIDPVIDLGFHGLNPLEPQCNDIIELKRTYGKKIVLMGNYDIGGILAHGSPAEVRTEVKRLLPILMDGGGYIAMSSSSLADSVVPENYQALIETIMEFGKY